MTPESQIKRVKLGLTIAIGIFLILIAGLLYVLNISRETLSGKTYDQTGIASIQLRVNYEKMMEGLALAEIDAIDPDELSVRFDILFERVDTLLTRPSYRDLLDLETLAIQKRIRDAMIVEIPAFDTAAAMDSLAPLDGVRERMILLRPDLDRLAHRPAQRASELRGIARSAQETAIIWLTGIILASVMAGALFIFVIRRQMQIAADSERAARASRDELGRQLIKVEAMRERLEQRAQEERRLYNDLDQARERLNDAIESMSEGFAVWDAEDHLALCNKRFEAFFPILAGATKAGLAFREYVRSRLVDSRPAARHWARHRHEREFRICERLSDGRWVEISERATRSGQRVTVVTDVSERTAAEAEIRRMAMQDALTGLPNRASFQNALQAAAQRRREGWTGGAGVMLLDLDDFKTVNDTFGHATGDDLLQVVAERLRASVDERHLVARLGGDEFAVVFTSNPGEAFDSGAAAQRIVDAMSKPFRVGDTEIHSSASVGIAEICCPSEDADTPMRRADIALYHAKSEGGGGYRMFDEDLERAARERSALEQDLQLAIERDQLFLEYQPKIDLKTGDIVGAEALLRWRHPERGLVSPAAFIPIAEASRQIVEIGEWVLARSIAQLEEWTAAGRDVGLLSVNISPLQIRLADFAETVRDLLDARAIDPHQLELEVTESIALTKDAAMLRNLETLRGYGVQIAIDDFGTDYSSLERIRDITADRLKIDRSFVKDIERSKHDLAICTAAINLGHALGLTVVAEGIETTKQCELLWALGCDEAQGFYFARPMSAEDFAAFVETPGENARAWRARNPEHLRLIEARAAVYQ